MTPLYAIRLAMLGGVLLFGAVSWFVHRSPGWTPTGPDEARALGVAARALWAIAVAGVAILVLRARRITDPARLGSLAIIGWAMGESTALFGAVIYYLTGRSEPYFAGLAFLALTFVIFPLRR